MASSMLKALIAGNAIAGSGQGSIKTFFRFIISRPGVRCDKQAPRESVGGRGHGRAREELLGKSRDTGCRKYGLR